MIFIGFISVFVLVLSVVTLVQEKSPILLGENRSADYFDQITIAGFYTEDTQQNIERSLADQFFLRDSFIHYSSAFEQKVNDLIYPKTEFDNDTIETISEFYYLVNDKIFLEKKPSTGIYQTEVTNFLTNPEYASRMITKNAEYHNLLSEFADVYVYEPFNSIYLSEQLFGETNFLDYQTEYLLQLSPDIKYDKLHVEGLEEYQQYYYTVDHHWNDVGIRAAYTDIVKLMDIESETSVIYDELICFDDIEFRGSHVRRTGLTEYYQNPCMYTFIETGEYTVNGVPKSLNYVREEYKLGNYYELLNPEKFWDFYSNINNRMYNIVINYDDESKENLLILGDSYSKGMVFPLSGYFNETHLLPYNSLDRDPDHEEYINPNLRSYIEDNDIDKILIMPHYYHLYMRETNFIFN